jgi:hypothetical protein
MVALLTLLAYLDRPRKHLLFFYPLSDLLVPYEKQCTYRAASLSSFHNVITAFSSRLTVESLSPERSSHIAYKLDSLSDGLCYVDVHPTSLPLML